MPNATCLIITFPSSFSYQPQQQVKPQPNVLQNVCDKNKTTVVETKQKKVKTKKTKPEIVKPVRPVQMPKSIPHAQETKPQLIHQDDKHHISTSRPPSTSSVCSNTSISSNQGSQNHFGQTQIAHNGPSNSNVQIVRPSVAQNNVHVRNINTSQCNTTPSNVNVSSILPANNSIRMTSTTTQRSPHLMHQNQQHHSTGVISQANIAGSHMQQQQQLQQSQQQTIIQSQLVPSPPIQLQQQQQQLKQTVPAPQLTPNSVPPLVNVNSTPQMPRVQTIQLTPQKQQLLKNVQLQIQTLSSKLQNKSLLSTLSFPSDFDANNPLYNKPLPQFNMNNMMSDVDIHQALQRLFIEQQKILATGKIIPTLPAGHGFATTAARAKSPIALNNPICVAPSGTLMHSPVPTTSPKIKQEPSIITNHSSANAMNQTTQPVVASCTLQTNQQQSMQLSNNQPMVAISPTVVDVKPTLPIQLQPDSAMSHSSFAVSKPTSDASKLLEAPTPPYPVKPTSPKMKVPRHCL